MILALLPALMLAQPLPPLLNKCTILLLTSRKRGVLLGASKFGYLIYSDATLTFWRTNGTRQ